MNRDGFGPGPRDAAPGPSGAARLRVYLDIDGTILYDPGTAEAREELEHQLVGEGIEELLTFVVAHCDPYWLSYRAKRGITRHLEERLFPHLPEVARRIPTAYWDRAKHEAVDPSLPFVWFEDDLDPEDLAWLEANRCLDRFVAVDATERLNPVLMLREVRGRLGIEA